MKGEHKKVVTDNFEEIITNLISARNVKPEDIITKTKANEKKLISDKLKYLNIFN